MSAITKKTGNRERRDAITGWLFMLPFVLGFALVFLLPIATSIYASFFQQVAAGGGLYGGGNTVDEFVAFENYKNIAGDSRFWVGVGRVLIYTAIQVPIMIISALILALILDSYLVRRVTVFRLGYFLPFAIPGIVAAMVWVYLYTKEISPLVDGLRYLGIEADFFHRNMVLASMANMTTWTYTGYNMLIFLAALQAIPNDLSEAARLDGASGFQIVTKIKIPMVRGAALLTVLLSIIGTIQLYSEPTVMAVINTWMELDYMPMQIAYNTLNGKLSPSGTGPGSAVSIMIALIAGTLAVIYAITDRKVNGNDL
ncbi:sugar ABC transporter permease [Gleimia sp. 6138-11-ORH1]|uniref:carbohydrate ABC transporter permease n=1 Tax=Gleimia sp. 6138-11-ORH1 TaxID=2973937 RepID=UPI002168301E|nr:sugar ABC transporter permease [Gleimia sp. 6138-11-ORH1]MCS4484974.1 sugar ABC transporter permease [Gleimia sp. 6138-11-ORH1]